jgi:Peroxidase, family 2
LLAALQSPETYHLSCPLANVLVHGGFFMMHDTKTPSLSLHELCTHNLIEHDASVVHKDAAPGHKFAPSRCDTGLLNKLLASDNVTLETVARRREELEREAPLDIVHQEVARGEWALVLDIFGREHDGKLRADDLRVWLKDNRFPDGWKPTHEQGLMATVSEASQLRKEMNKLRKEYQDSKALAATEGSRDVAHSGGN